MKIIKMHCIHVWNFQRLYTDILFKCMLFFFCMLLCGLLCGWLGFGCQSHFSWLGFPSICSGSPPPTPSFCFRSRLSSQTSISFLTTSLLLFSYLLLIAGSDCLMVTALKCLAAVVASLTRQR